MTAKTASKGILLVRRRRVPHVVWNRRHSCNLLFYNMENGISRGFHMIAKYTPHFFARHDEKLMVYEIADKTAMPSCM